MLPRALDALSLVGSVLVPPGAVGLECIPCNYRFASKKILSSRHRLKMGRIDAPSIPTQVVQVERLINWTNKSLVSIAMGIRPSAILSTLAELPIAASLVDASGPLPAAIVGNDYLAPESIWKLFISKLDHADPFLKGWLSFTFYQVAMPGLVNVKSSSPRCWQLMNRAASLLADPLGVLGGPLKGPFQLLGCRQDLVYHTLKTAQLLGVPTADHVPADPTPDAVLRESVVLPTRTTGMQLDQALRQRVPIGAPL